jgi:glutamate synthase domain-containing protein 3
MTGGVAVVIGDPAATSPRDERGAAFLFDESGESRQRCNLEMVDLEPLREPEDIETVRDLLIQHAGYTGSEVAAASSGTGTGRREVHQGHARRLSRVLEEQKQAAKRLRRCKWR